MNRFNKETFVFTHPVEDGTCARFDVVLQAGGSGGGNAIAHINPKIDEYFDVHSGRLMVMIDGKEYLAGPGERAMVPRGSAHYFLNADNGETHAAVSFTPGQQQLRFFVNLAALTALHRDYFSPQDDAKLLPIALKLNAFRDRLYTAGPLIWVQKILYWTLAALATLMGYRLVVGPGDRPDKRAERLRDAAEA